MTEEKKAAKKPAKKVVKKTGFKNSVKGKDKAQFKASHSYVVFSVIMMSVEALIIVVLGMALTTISNGPKYIVDKDGNVAKVRQDKPVKHDEIVEGDHVEGNELTGVRLIWYVDMQCPACASMAPIIQALYETYGDRVAFVTRNLLISSHQYARPAAYAVEAAGEQGYYWDMLMETFAQRQEWAYVSSEDMLRERLAEIFMTATEGKGDKKKFLADMTSNKYESKISADEKLARDDNLSATPTIFINGKDIDFAGSTESPINMFAEELDKALEGK